MDFITILSAQAPEMTNWIGKLLLMLSDNVGNFGWTVVIFTIILKLCLTPLDVWQKVSMRKQQRAMAKMKPQLDKLQKQYANRPDILQQKQYELQKSSGMNILASCLPMIVTMIVFFVVFQGFRALIVYENEVILYKLNDIYINGKAAGLSMDEINAQLAAAYQPEQWLWIKNVFMSDIGTNVIPSLSDFTGSKINATFPDGLAASYDTLVGPAMALHNKTGTWDFANWNGYFVLPILAIGTSFLSTFLMQKLQPAQLTAPGTQQESQQKTMKMMTYIMPLMLGIFAIMYSAAFAIYYVVSNIISTISSLLFTIGAKNYDKKKNV